MMNMRLIFETSVSYPTDYDSPGCCTKGHCNPTIIGEGTLTVLATAELFTNKSIGKKEHATLLWDLLTEGREDQVWIIHSTRLSFFKLLWQQASPCGGLAAGDHSFAGMVGLARVWSQVCERGRIRWRSWMSILEASGAFFVKAWGGCPCDFPACRDGSFAAWRVP